MTSPTDCVWATVCEIWGELCHYLRKVHRGKRDVDHLVPRPRKRIGKRVRQRNVQKIDVAAGGKKINSYNNKNIMNIYI